MVNVRMIVTPVMFLKVDRNPSTIQETISTAPPGICRRVERMDEKPNPLIKALMKFVTLPFRIP